MSVLASLTHVWVVVDQRRPHTAHPVAKVSKVKTLVLILLISVFSLSSLHLLSKKASQEIVGFATLYFTHSR